jgi:hypothetical protein
MRCSTLKDMLSRGDILLQSMIPFGTSDSHMLCRCQHFIREWHDQDRLTMEQL